MSVPVDSTIDVVNAFVRALKQCFNANDQVQPPLGGGSTTVHFLAGDVVPLEMWDAFSNSGADCQEPFLWVRLVDRFRSANFPAQTVDVNSCSLPRVVRVEVGVGRCAAIPEADGTYNWTDVAQTAEYSLDDSWRIEATLCAAKSLLSKNAVATDTIKPLGPDGGIYAWAGTAFVQL